MEPRGWNVARVGEGVFPFLPFMMPTGPVGQKVSPTLWGHLRELIGRLVDEPPKALLALAGDRMRAGEHFEEQHGDGVDVGPRSDLTRAWVGSSPSLERPLSGLPTCKSGVGAGTYSPDIQGTVRSIF